MDPTIIRHEFLATLTVINPSDLPEHGHDDDSSESASESEMLELLGIKDGGRSAQPQAEDSPSTDEDSEESTTDDEDSSTDEDSLDSIDSADFDLKEDFETASDCSEDPDRYGGKHQIFFFCHARNY